MCVHVCKHKRGAHAWNTVTSTTGRLPARPGAEAGRDSAMALGCVNTRISTSSIHTCMYENCSQRVRRVFMCAWTKTKGWNIHVCVYAKTKWTRCLFMHACVRHTPCIHALHNGMGDFERQHAQNCMCSLSIHVFMCENLTQSTHVWGTANAAG